MGRDEHLVSVTLKNFNPINTDLKIISILQLFVELQELINNISEPKYPQNSADKIIITRWVQRRV
jgi:hypothetical protein